MTRPIDLRSDTVTKPSEAMRAAMAAAEVGDDWYGDDPTVNRLQDAAAEAVGKEAALYVATGTMGNQIAMHAQTRAGHFVGRRAGLPRGDHRGLDLGHPVGHRVPRAPQHGRPAHAATRCARRSSPTRSTSRSSTCCRWRTRTRRPAGCRGASTSSAP